MSVEKDAKERAQRRQENQVAADGNCRPWVSAAGRLVGTCARVCELMFRDMSIPRRWGPGGPEAVGPDQAEAISVLSCVTAVTGGGRTLLSSHLHSQTSF